MINPSRFGNDERKKSIKKGYFCKQKLPMFTGENKEKTQTTKSYDLIVWVS